MERAHEVVEKGYRAFKAVASVSTKIASAPFASKSAAAAMPEFAFFSAMRTAAPSLAERVAIAAPMPRPAPVTEAPFINAACITTDGGRSVIYHD